MKTRKQRRRRSVRKGGIGWRKALAAAVALTRGSSVTGTHGSSVTGTHGSSVTGTHGSTDALTIPDTRNLTLMDDTGTRGSGFSFYDAQSKLQEMLTLTRGMVHTATQNITSTLLTAYDTLTNSTNHGQKEGAVGIAIEAQSLRANATQVADDFYRRLQRANDYSALAQVADDFYAQLNLRDARYSVLSNEYKKIRKNRNEVLIASEAQRKEFNDILVTFEPKIRELNETLVSFEAKIKESNEALAVSEAQVILNDATMKTMSEYIKNKCEKGVRYLTASGILVVFVVFLLKIQHLTEKNEQLQRKLEESYNKFNVIREAYLNDHPDERARLLHAQKEVEKNTREANDIENTLQIKNGTPPLEQLVNLANHKNGHKTVGRLLRFLDN